MSSSDKTVVQPIPTQSAVTEKRLFVKGDLIKGRFRIDTQLGEGGMGVVYKALDLIQVEAKDKDPWVAIKVMDASLLSSQDALMCLQRETRKSRSLSHPNIVTVFDVDRDNDCVFMTMEYLQGTTLDVWIKENHGKSYHDYFDIWLSIASALDYAHSQGIVHCDFKPNNVFIRDDGTVKIIDFGIARANADLQVKAVTTRFNIGDLGALTPAYASCEMIESLAPTAKDDIYSFALVMYEMLTGNHPYDSQMATQARARGMKPKMITGLDVREWKRLSAGLSFEQKMRPNRALDLLSEEHVRSIFTSWYKKVLLVSVIVACVSIPAVFYLAQVEPNDPPTQTELDLEERRRVDNLPAEIKQEIDNLLFIAEAHFDVGRVIEPIGGNALEAYKQVLDVDPSNRKAKEGIQQIANQFYRDAKQYYLQKDIERAYAATQQGLKISPEHEGLIQLLSELEN